MIDFPAKGLFELSGSLNTIRLVHTDNPDVGMSEYEEHEARTLRNGSTRRGGSSWDSSVVGCGTSCAA